MNLSPECAAIECERPPSHYVVVRVPAIGSPLGATVGLTFGLALCRDHAEATTPDDLLSDEGKAMLTRELAIRGKEAPDFTLAKVDVRRIGDQNWTDFQSRTAADQQGGTA